MRAVATAFLLTLMLAVSACMVNPLSRAETIEQRAFALYGSFVIFEEQAVQLFSDSTTPMHVKRAIVDADQAAKPVFDSLMNATIELAAIRAEYQAGQTDREKLEIATQNLHTWYLRAVPRLTALVEAVRSID